MKNQIEATNPLIELANELNGVERVSSLGENLDYVIEKLNTGASFDDMPDQDRKQLFTILHLLKKAFINYNY